MDGVGLDAVDRSALRRRFIAIPQDPVFLPDGSTVRENLDPGVLVLGGGDATADSRHSDEECRAVLEAVGLWQAVDELNGGGGLGAPLNAESLSHGQRQLFSLARAVLRGRAKARAATATTTASQSIKGQQQGRGVLLLDEVSSSVDRDTEQHMHEIIKREFTAFTIVMVSHRLEMVMDGFDRVIVMDRGRVVESGAPRDLVATKGTRFGELWAVRNGK